MHPILSWKIGNYQTFKDILKNPTQDSFERYETYHLELVEISWLDYKLQIIEFDYIKLMRLNRLDSEDDLFFSKIGHSLIVKTPTTTQPNLT